MTNMTKQYTVAYNKYLKLFLIISLLHLIKLLYNDNTYFKNIINKYTYIASY